MKIVVTAKEDTPDGEMDPHFGRARKFVLFDDETGLFSAHDNAQNLNAAQGAGIQAAESVVRLGAGAVITGHVGPKAFKVLEAAGIPVYLAANCTAGEALDRFKQNKLSKQTTADVQGHWV